MPIVIVLLLAVLIAQFGFWDTFEGILGAVAMLVLFLLLLVAFLALVGWYGWRRLTIERDRRLTPPPIDPTPRVDRPRDVRPDLSGR